MANHIRITVGRLLEVRLGPIRTTEDVDAWFNAVGNEMAKLPTGERAVVAADWRSCSLLSEEASQRAVRRLTQSNPRVERSSALVAQDSALGVLQLMRVVRETQHPSRKLFYTPEDCISWLQEVLTPPEAARLVEFLQPAKLKSGT